MSIKIYPSLVGSIIGVNKYKSRMHTLLGYVAKRDTTSKESCRRTLRGYQPKFEADAIQVLEETNNLSCYKADKLILESNVGWHLIGQCDGITSDGHIVEVKSRMKYIHDHISWNDYAQIQSYLALYDMNKCYYVQKIAQGTDTKIELIKRDTWYWNHYIIPELTRFAQVVSDMRHEQSDTIMNPQHK